MGSFQHEEIGFFFKATDYIATHQTQMNLGIYLLKQQVVILFQCKWTVRLQ